MNLRDLEYLIAIDEEKHFNKAAERCFVSQPTLSGQLKKLEDTLGVLLVERNNRQVKMTQAGVEITNQARQILAETKALKEIAQNYQDPMAGDLHVGLIPTVAPYLLPIIIPALKKQCPKLKLWLHEHQTHILLDKLRNAELDFLILALPVQTSEFSEFTLFEEPFWLAIPKDEKLAHQKNIQLTDLENREVLLLEEGHCLRGQALDVCFAGGATEHSGFQATSLETLRHMVAENMGITLIPELAVPAKRRKDDAVRYLPFDDPRPTRRIGLLYRNKSYRSEVLLTLAKIIQQTMVKLNNT